jgi:branched-chain amino acid transport system substrate-binding protein
VLSAEGGNGIVTFASYFETIDTPTNKAFLDRWHKRFGKDYPVVTEFACNTYQGMHLWAKAVAQAGTTDRMKVIEALETGISFDGPSGKVTIDPQTHHVKLDARMAKAENQTFAILKQWDQQASIDTQAVCNLTANPGTNEQFVITP